MNAKYFLDIRACGSFAYDAALVMPGVPMLNITQKCALKISEHGVLQLHYIVKYNQQACFAEIRVIVGVEGQFHVFRFCPFM